MNEQSSSRFEPAVPLEDLRESKNNPRKHFDPEALKELEQSIREKGVLTPLLVRTNGKGFEIAAGHRRFRAAKAAGLEAVPAVVRDMTDAELLEVLVIENDQREDVHPLEEAAGYQALIRTAKYDVARIAARIGRSPKYVYDRLKLLELVPKAQKLFLEGRFTAGHAILLARLPAEKQREAVEFGEDHYGEPPIFQAERNLFSGDVDDEEATERDCYAGLKAVSVREFEAWIDRNVRADRDSVDPMLFPETAALLESARAEGEKILPIMNLSVTPYEIKGGEKILTENAWRRADGLQGSKPCDISEVGVVTIGPGRYEAFRICRKKERCMVHWAAEIKARKQHQAAAAKGDTKAADRYREKEKKEAEDYRARQAREEAERTRWEKARPAILEATAGRVRALPAKATGFLADLIIVGLRNYQSVKTDLVHVPRGKSAEDLVRHVAFLVLAARTRGYHAQEDFTKLVRSIGIDVRKILDQVAPVKAQTSAKPQPGTCLKCGCTEEAACEGGCGWVDKEKTLCSSCAAPAEIDAATKGSGKRTKKGGR